MLINDTAIEFLTNEMLFAKINAEEDTLIAQKYNAKAYPTFILADSDGNEIDRIVGYMPTQEFIKTMRDYTNGIGTLDDLLAQAEKGADRSLYFEIADKYKYRGDGDDALNWYEKIIAEGSPTDSLSGESRMALADMYRRDKDYDKALKAYQAVADDFKGTSFEEGADVYVAYTTMTKGDTTAAIASFESFIKKYPDSEENEWAEKQIKKLNGEEESEESKE